MVKTNGHLIRRTVFWIVFLGGGLTLAGLIFYFSGYRLDWQTKRLIQLGSLAVTVTPKESQIFLDGKLLNKTTPAIFNSLRPGDYTLRLEHIGNSPLELPISITSKTTTVVGELFLPSIARAQPSQLNNIQTSTAETLTPTQLSALALVKDWPIWSVSGQQPTGVITGPNRQLSLIQNQQVTPVKKNVTQLDTNSDLHQLAFIQSGTAWILYTNTDPLVQFILTRQSDPLVDLALVPQMQAVVVADAQHIQLIEVGLDQTVVNLNIASGQDIQRLRLENNGHTLYYLDGTVWYQQELQSQ